MGTVGTKFSDAAVQEAMFAFSVAPIFPTDIFICSV
jgi:hypothetical protein